MAQPFDPALAAQQALQQQLANMPQQFADLQAHNNEVLANAERSMQNTIAAMGVAYFVCLGIAAYILYWLIRLGVRHALQDVQGKSNPFTEGRRPVTSAQLDADAFIMSRRGSPTTAETDFSRAASERRAQMEREAASRYAPQP